ncbi:MAG: ATP-binding protein [Okeania sp. SIO2H7]|nr:ATP-binding protein [Okeania sp. SIO2H7]
MSADFLADYLTTFFPGNDEEPDRAKSRLELKSSISYIANELLENAMKFNDQTSNYPISIQLHLKSDRIILAVTNSIPPQEVDKFQSYLEELTTSKVEDLLLRQLEQNVLEENSNFSGLGYLTIINDYMAKMGWKLETVRQEPEVTAVTTMVQLKV